MAMKWLQERWQIFFPVLEALGQAQEEQIKALCEAELAAWRARPRMKEPNSLRKPLTETRNHIRETLPLREDNWWLNPKSGAREHLSLKYLNFSSQEWIELTLPSPQELEARRMSSFSVSDPDGLLAQVQRLFEQKTWQELVLAVGLATGRSVAEILKTGVFTAKTAYSVYFAGPMTVYEVMCEPFEVPTLVRAEQILEAVAFLRELFGMHFAGVERRDVSQQASPLVREAAYTHFLGRVALRPPNQDLYRSLTHGIYPRLAVYAYCPSGLDEIRYMATIQNHRKILEASSEEERVTFATAAGYLDYQLVDAAGMRERRRGIRLSDPGVEILSVFKQWESKPEAGVEQGSVEEEMTGEEDDEEDYDEEEELRQVLSYVIVDHEGNSDRRQGIRLGEPGVEVLEIFKRQAGEPRADAGVTVKIGERTCWLLDEVREAEHGCSYDAVFTELLDAYDSLYRSGLLAQVKHVAGVALFDLFAHRQDRLLVKRAMQVTVSPDLFTFFQKAALTYARACVKEGEEEKGDNTGPSEDVIAGEGMLVDPLVLSSSVGQKRCMQPSPVMQDGAGVGGSAERKVLLNVSKPTWARFAQAKEELGIASDDEVLVLLQKAYALTYYSDPFDLIDQVEEVVSLAISSLRLGVDKQSLIKEAMKYEGVTKAFAFLQESILMYAEAIVSDERGSDQFSENKQE